MASHAAMSARTSAPPLQLPDLGAIGSNGLANPRDFQTPVAWYEDREGKFELVNKFMGNLWAAELDHSPLDVVAWHGNMAPYKYDLRRFNTIGSISYRPSRSIDLSRAAVAFGYARCRHDRLRDFPAALACHGAYVPAALVPSQRRKRIHGSHPRRVRREGRGFVPGGASLHNCMSGHGPDAETFEKASTGICRSPTASPTRWRSCSKRGS